MAKKIRFPLEMKGGVEVRDIEELKENFSLEHILVYLEDGKLTTWLRDRYQDEIADAVLALNREDVDFYKKICDIFDVEYVEEQAEDIEKAMERNRKRTLLKEFTDEEKFYDMIDRIAFEQDDLYDLLDEGITEIYLCGEKFFIPLGTKGVKYIGVNHPAAVISSKEKVDFAEKGITFQGVRFDEKYAEIVAAETSSDEVFESDSNLDRDNDALGIYEDGDLMESFEMVEELSNEAWEQVEHLICDLNDCIDSFLEKTIKKYKPRRIIYNGFISLHISYYSSYQYLFQTDTAAKTGCKRVIDDFVNGTYDSYESQKNIVISACKEFVECIKSDILDFIVEFTSAIDNFIFMDCEYEARAYVEKRMEIIADKSRLMKQYEDLDFREKVESYIHELFMKPINREIKVKEYFDMCTYGYDGKRYCYIINNAIDSVVDSVKELYNEACKTMEKRIKELYVEILADYCDGIKKKLSAMHSKKNNESCSGELEFVLPGVFFGSLFGSNGKIGENPPKKNTDCAADITSWWDEHLANAHKESDK